MPVTMDAAPGTGGFGRAKRAAHDFLKGVCLKVFAVRAEMLVFCIVIIFAIQGDHLPDRILLSCVSAVFLQGLISQYFWVSGTG